MLIDATEDYLAKKNAERARENIVSLLQRKQVPEHQKRLFKQIKTLLALYFEKGAVEKASEFRTTLDLCTHFNNHLDADPTAKIEYYETLAEGYFANNDFGNALLYYLQALHLAIETRNTKKQAALEHAISVVEATYTTLAQWRVSCPMLSDPLTLDFDSVVSKATKLQWFAETLKKNNQWGQIKALYQGNKPLIDRLLSCFEAKLSRTRQKESPEKYKQAAEKILKIADTFREHRLDEKARQCFTLFTQRSYQHKDMRIDITERLSPPTREEKTAPLTGKPKTKETWKLYRAQLEAHRNVLKAMLGKPDTDLAKALGAYTNNIKQLIHEMAKKCREELGDPPCEFELLGIGSISRGEMLPYSDLDIAMLVEKSQHRNDVYFKEFILLLKFKLEALGEPAGLHIDSGDIGFLISDNNPDHLNTPVGLAKHVDPKTIIPAHTEARSLHKSVSLYASEKKAQLLTTYRCHLNRDFQLLSTNQVQKLIDNQFAQVMRRIRENTKKPLGQSSTRSTRRKTQEIPMNVLEDLKALLSQEAPENSERPKMPSHQALAKKYLEVGLDRYKRNQKHYGKKNETDVKDCVASPLTCLIQDIALYFGLMDETNPGLMLSTNAILDQLEKEKYLSSNFVQALRQAWNIVLGLRLKVHFKMREQREKLNKPNASEASTEYEESIASHAETTPTDSDPYILTPEEYSDLQWVGHVLKIAYTCLDVLSNKPLDDDKLKKYRRRSGDNAKHRRSLEKRRSRSSSGSRSRSSSRRNSKETESLSEETANVLLFLYALEEQLKKGRLPDAKMASFVLTMLSETQESDIQIQIILTLTSWRSPPPETIDSVFAFLNERFGLEVRESAAITLGSWGITKGTILELLFSAEKNPITAAKATSVLESLQKTPRQQFKGRLKALTVIPHLKTKAPISKKPISFPGDMEPENLDFKELAQAITPPSTPATAPRLAVFNRGRSTQPAASAPAAGSVRERSHSPTTH